MWWVWVLRAIWTVLFIMGTLPNLVVIFCVFTRTPTELRAYSVLLLDLACTELAASFSNWFIMERMIPSPQGLNFVAYGPCVVFGPHACFVAHTIMIHTYGNLALVVPLSFAFRYYVLVNSIPRWYYVAIVAFIAYAPGILALTVLNQIYGGPDLIRPMLNEEKYDDVLNATDVQIYGLRDIHSWQNGIVLIYITAPWIPAYILAIFFRQKIIKGIKMIGNTISPKTVRMHSTLVKALTLQACVPLIGVLAVATFLVAQVGLINHPALEMSSFMITCFVPILNGSITVYFVPHYRAVVTRWFCSQKKVTPTITVVSSALS